MALQSKMVDLTDKECDFLIRVWRVCPVCKTPIEKGWISDHQRLICDRHFEYRRLPQRSMVHKIQKVQSIEPFTLQLKQEVLRDYVKKTFNTDNAREAYRSYMKANLCTLTEDFSYDKSDLTEKEGNHLNLVWRICSGCSESVTTTSNKNDPTIGFMTQCGCFVHNSHCSGCTHTCRKLCTVKTYVEDMFDSKNVRGAYCQYMQDNFPRLIKEKSDETNDSQLRKELDNARRRISELEKENEQLKKENSAVKVESDYSVAKLVKISQEIKELKNKYRETQNYGEDFDEKQKDDFDVDTSDECILNFEWDSFKLQFNELQSKISELGQKCFSTRNTSMILELQQKVFPATITSSEVKEDVLNSLKNGTVKLKDAFDGLTPNTCDLPSSSSKKEQDAKLLD